ncbi:MAG: tetratricopeptide repeat protein, partial [Lewinellaceae bacterium]|nr:tetratricopeptide repeat protein [Lewinellaceae bacterium]
MKTDIYKLNMEPLSSFAINIAASIVFETFKGVIDGDAQKQLKTVFNKSINTLIINSIIRDKEKKEFEKFLEKYTANPFSLNEEERIKYNSFVKIFEQILPSYEKANRFVLNRRIEDLTSIIKSEKESEIKSLTERIDDLKELRVYDKSKIESLNTEIAKIEKEYQLKIQQLEEIGNASLKVGEELYKEALDLVFVNKIDEALEILNEKRLEDTEKHIRENRKKEDFELAQRRILKARLYIIKAQFEEAKIQFEKAITINKTPSNIFEYAKYLQELKYLDKALEKYEEALMIYRELAKENPRTYLSYVAMTLNNLANLHSDKNEFPQALEKYEEALQIYRELTKENPRTYLPDVAMTLNNLANLHSDKNEFPQAL